MIRLGVRLAVSGGRESVVRLLLTAVGVGIGTTLLLLAAATDPAIRAQQRHTAWQHTVGEPAGADHAGEPLLWQLTTDGVAGEQLLVLRVAATGPGSPVPLGLDRVPAPGDVHVSPALGRLLGELPRDRLADRFPSAPSGRIGDDHLAGPDALVAVIGVEPSDLVGPAVGAGFDRPSGVMEVLRINDEPPAFRFSDFLRIVLGIGAVGLLLPVVVFVSTSTRIGAARRERRFAAMRLAGATPRQTAAVAAVEAVAASTVGALLGLAGYQLLRPTLAGIELDGHASFLDDVRVAPWLAVAVVLAVPALAAAAAVVSLGRLRISALGVARHAVRARPTARRAVPLLVGTVGFAASIPAVAGRPGALGLAPVVVTFGLMIYGIVAVGPWCTVLAARALGRLSRRSPSVLLAGRRLEDDPAAGFRSVSGLVLAVFVATVFSGITPAMQAENRRHDGIAAADVLVAGLPAGTTGDAARTAVAAAVAAAGGDAVVLHADPDPTRPLADPARGRTETPIVDCADAGLLDVDGTCPVGGTAWVDTGLDDPEFEPAPFTPAEVTAFPAALVVIDTDGTPAATDRVRTAVVAAVPGAVPWLGAEVELEANRRLVQLNRIANLALAITLTIAGCGLAVAVAAGIIERQRPFALLRLAGMHLAELRRTALLEAAAPLLLIASACAVLGLATAAAAVELAGDMAWVAPSVGYWLSLAGGLAVALAVAASALPLLGRATAPAAVRFE